jgi:hypothetical protein
MNIFECTITSSPSQELLLNRITRAEKSQYWNSKSKFILVSTQRERTFLASTTSFFYTMALLDAIIIGQDGIGIQVISYNPFEKEPAKRVYDLDLRKKVTIEVAFPDKLKDMKGHRYKARYRKYFPDVFFKGDQNDENGLTGMAKFFIDTIAKHQNATVNYKRDSLEINKEIRLAKALTTQQADLNLNTNLMMFGKDADKFKLVNTYETDGFCVMLPYSTRKSFFEIIIKPFDLWTWILIMTSVTLLIVVWHFLNMRSNVPNPDSPWLLLFAFYAFFVGQGVEFRRNRLMQKVLIQLMIIMTFFLGNLYQSDLTSQMAEARNGERITTVEEMLAKNYTFHVDILFSRLLRSSGTHQNLQAKITGNFETQYLDYEKLAAENVGIISSCNNMYIMFHDMDQLYRSFGAVDYYYRLPEKIFTWYLSYTTAPYSIYADRLQEYSLRIHESGRKLNQFVSLVSIKMS